MRLLAQCRHHHCWSSDLRCLDSDSLSLQRDRRCCPEPIPAASTGARLAVRDGSGSAEGPYPT